MTLLAVASISTTVMGARSVQVELHAPLDSAFTQLLAAIHLSVGP